MAKKERTKEVVRRRIDAMVARTPEAEHGEGVTPLACGYFQLQHMKQHTMAKKKAKQERKVLHSDR